MNERRYHTPKADPRRRVTSEWRSVLPENVPECTSWEQFSHKVSSTPAPPAPPAPPAQGQKPAPPAPPAPPAQGQKPAPPAQGQNEEPAPPAQGQNEEQEHKGQLTEIHPESPAYGMLTTMCESTDHVGGPVTASVTTKGVDVTYTLYRMGSTTFRAKQPVKAGVVLQTKVRGRPPIDGGGLKVRATPTQHAHLYSHIFILRWMNCALYCDVMATQAQR
jgi:hypothetical protein